MPRCPPSPPSAQPAIAQTDAYPNHAIKLIVPFPPGGASDLTARTLPQKMGESMGQTIVVDNRPGANGVLGVEMVAKAPADGHTILLSDRGSFTVNPAVSSRSDGVPARLKPRLRELSLRCR